MLFDSQCFPGTNLSLLWLHQAFARGQHEISHVDTTRHDGISRNMFLKNPKESTLVHVQLTPSHYRISTAIASILQDNGGSFSAPSNLYLQIWTRNNMFDPN